MSLRSDEQRALDAIEASLAGAAPELAAMLSTFARLAAGDEMPVRERLHRPSRRGRNGRHSSTGGTGRHVCWESLALALWLATTIALITVGVVLGRPSGTQACSVSAVPCIWQAPARTVGAAARSLEIRR